MDINRSIIESHQKARANQMVEEKGVEALPTPTERAEPAPAGE